MFSEFSSEEEEPAKIYSDSVKERVNSLVRYLNELDPKYIPDFYDFPEPSTNPELYPKSYSTNSSIELKCLDFVSNFKTQYKRVFKERKSLILTPINELGVKKFICTYICPVKWCYPEFLTWEGCASFVSDYLNYLPLVPSTNYPSVIYSSNSVLKFQKGNSFDYSILLCSLLIGSGFDAYIVNGYATREVCYLDQTREECPFLIDKKFDQPRHKNEPPSKYMVKPTKYFQSVYDLTQIAKEIKNEKDNEILEKKRSEEEILESEKPPIDPLFGLRVHAWVLVKAGLQDVKEDFFIDAFTGNYVKIGDKRFLGIESIFNDSNYWLNKFYCGDGLENINFDLNNLTNWEPIFLEFKDDTAHDPSIVDDEHAEKHQNEEFKGIDIPLSWIRNLNIDKYQYEKRYPYHQKQRNYYKVQQFLYSPDFCLSGLEMRLKIYDDLKYQNLLETQEFLKRRDDYHYKSVIYSNGKTTQYFEYGNEFYLKEYTFDKYNPGPENNKEIVFHNHTRYDGLIRRLETKISLEETYIDRKDFLEKMYVEFYPRETNLSVGSMESPYRDVVLVIKKFRRNPAVEPDKDIEELIFKLFENKIYIRYHLDKFSIVPSTREFIKPPISTDGKANLLMQANTHSYFKSNPTVKKETNLEIYEMLKSLLDLEKQTLADVKSSEVDSKIIINNRVKAIRHDKLFCNLFDTIRNDEAKSRRKELQIEYQNICSNEEEQLDFLAPYLSQIQSFAVTNRETAFEVREMALFDLKKRLIKQANLIKIRFEKETDDLQKKQTWYYQNKMILSLEEEQNYLKYCTTTVSLLDTLENLLVRHKQTAPHKYMDLERRIRQDPRIIAFM